MDYLRRFQSSMNDTDEDIEAQGQWEDRPWRYLPTYLQLPAATIGGIYRNLSVSKKKDPTLRKDSSFQAPEMPRKQKTRKKRESKRTKKAVKKAVKIASGLGRMAGPMLPKRLAKRYTFAGKRRGKKVGYSQLSGDVRKRFTTEQGLHARSSRASFNRSNVFSDGLVMRGRQRLGQLQAVPAYTQPQILFDATLSSARNDTILPFNPSMFRYFSEPLTTMSRVFTKFMFENVTLEYETATPTSTQGKVMFGYSSDVDYLEGLGYSGSVPAINQPDLVKLPNCVTSPYWKDFNYVVPITQNQTVRNFFVRNEYTSNSTSGGEYILDNANDTAEDRQSFQGMLFISGTTSSADASSNTLYGDLYMSYTIHFGGIGASQAAPVTPGPLGVSESDRKFYIKYQRIKALEDKKLQEDKQQEAKVAEEYNTRLHLIPAPVDSEFVSERSAEELARLAARRSHDEEVRKINLARDQGITVTRELLSRSSSKERKAQ